MYSLHFLHADIRAVESQAIDEVEARLASEHASLPTGPNGRDDRNLILWFLRDRKFDVDKAVEKLATAIVSFRAKLELFLQHVILFTSLC